MTAYKRNKKIKDTIIRAKIITGNNRAHRSLKGMKKCGKCLACSYIIEDKSIKTKKFTWKLNRQVNCNSSNVVYMVKCDKNNCNMQYIGETEREFKMRILEHIGYAKNNQQNKKTGHHFNMPGHSWKNIQFIILEKVLQNYKTYREEREKYLI